MGFLRRRSWLERTALAVLVALVVVIAFVASGVQDDDAETTARRLTAICAPVAQSLPAGGTDRVTQRDLARLRFAATTAADAMGDLIKDADRERREVLQGLVIRLQLAGGSAFVPSATTQASALTGVERRAAAIGARCPAPLSVQDGEAIDRRLARQR